MKSEQKKGDNKQEQLSIPVYIVISFFNEARTIEKKINNLLELEYPLLKFILVDDFSNDGSSEIIQSFKDERIILLKNTNKGKTHAQNLAVSLIPDNSIIVFNDCNVFLEKNSIRELVHAFEEDIGGISGNVTIWESGNRKKGLEGRYWEWEKQLKLVESYLGVAIGFDGGFYAIRSKLYTSLPPDALSDFEQAINILAQGYKVIYCSKARANEFEYRELRFHFSARRRVTVRTLWALERTLRKLKALPPWGYLFLMFNKYIRYYCIYFSPLILGSMVWHLYEVSPLMSYILFFVIWVFMILSIYVQSLQRFVVLVFALYAGLFDYLLRKRVTYWEQQRR